MGWWKLFGPGRLSGHNGIGILLDIYNFLLYSGDTVETMGACQSSQDGEEEEKKKRSRMIDAKLLEDERRLKKECKILLLGTIGLVLDLVSGDTVGLVH